MENVTALIQASLDGDNLKTVAMAMRTILRDYWRQRTAAKRGGKDGCIVELGDGLPDAVADDAISIPDFIALDQALDRMAQCNPRWLEVVLHRYFAGLTIDETAEAMGCGTDRVKPTGRAGLAEARVGVEV